MNRAAPKMNLLLATAQIESENIPKRIPLYWKWMWSTSSMPGWAARRKKASLLRDFGQCLVTKYHVVERRKSSVNMTERRWKVTVARLA